ncbi:hypothetical protein BT69DRAFT_1384178 [Atractiella rhizophila]|nr:hypothetical protein BT69DRAFT_1384178 [Atractiella rhizophila]
MFFLTWPPECKRRRISSPIENSSTAGTQRIGDTTKSRKDLVKDAWSSKQDQTLDIDPNMNPSLFLELLYLFTTKFTSPEFTSPILISLSSYQRNAVVPTEMRTYKVPAAGRSAARCAVWEAARATSSARRDLDWQLDYVHWMQSRKKNEEVNEI